MALSPKPDALPSEAEIRERMLPLLPDPVRNYRDYAAMDKSLAYVSWLYQTNRGVLMAPGAEENWTLSVQHSSEDVRRYVDNFRELAKDLKG